MLHLFKQPTTFNGDSSSLIDKGILYCTTFNFKCLSSMFTKIYLRIAIVLRFYKKCSNFLWYFDGNSPVIICSFFSNKNVCLFLWCLFTLLKLLIGFRFYMHCLVVAWKSFTEAFLFLLYVRKDQVHEQSGYKLWFCFNKQKNDYLHWLHFSNFNNVSF